MELQRQRLQEMGFKDVYIGYNEMSRPSIEESLSKMIADGIDEVIAMPFFVASGLHMERDIPPKLFLKNGEHDKNIEVDGKKLVMHFGEPFGNDPLLTEILKERGIEALIVIGGDGSFKGAAELSKYGINVIGVPATIDMDIACTDYTIGFDTAMNTCMECIDKIRDTTSSHCRCSLTEVMGNKCGDLALFCGLAVGAEMILTQDHPIGDEEIFETLRKMKEIDPHKRVIIVVSEKLYPDIHAFGKRIQAETGFDTRANILGHVQRGGSPSAFDRVLAARMGAYAVDCLLEGKGVIAGF